MLIWWNWFTNLRNLKNNQDFRGDVDDEKDQKENVMKRIPLPEDEAPSAHFLGGRKGDKKCCHKFLMKEQINTHEHQSKWWTLK